jgi:glycosyltransferase involved in cell wall biosynthesis
MAKVVHLTSVHSARDVRIFHKECTSLAHAGYEVVLLAPHTRDEILDGVQVRALASSCRRLSRMTAGVARICKKAFHEQADIYHLHDPELLPVGLFLAGCGKTVIYDIHENVPLDIRDKEYLPSWSRSTISVFADRIEQFCSRHIAALIPATASIAQRVSKFNPRTVLVQNYPRVSESKVDHVPWNKRPSWVAYVGGLNAVRGGRELVRAMGLLPRGLEATLQLMGPYSPQFRGELQHIDGWSRVCERGVISRSQVAEALAQSRCGLLVNHPIQNHTDSEPNKMFEYMAAGLPLITSDFPLWREVIQRERCGLTVNPLDPKAIAQAIEYILTHDDEAREMGLRGHRAVEQRYNWCIAERRLLNLYSELLGRDPNQLS